jgi:hypothetical protein
METRYDGAATTVGGWANLIGHDALPAHRILRCTTDKTGYGESRQHSGDMKDLNKGGNG